MEKAPPRSAGASIAHIGIAVSALSESLSFYRDVLGLPFLFAAPPQMALPSGGRRQRLHLQPQTRPGTEATRAPEGKGHHLAVRRAPFPVKRRVKEDSLSARRLEAGRKNFHEV